MRMPWSTLVTFAHAPRPGLRNEAAKPHGDVKITRSGERLLVAPSQRDPFTD